MEIFVLQFVSTIFEELKKIPTLELGFNKIKFEHSYKILSI